jgi:hypothetical protein
VRIAASTHLSRLRILCILCVQQIFQILACAFLVLSVSYLIKIEFYIMNWLTVYSTCMPEYMMQIINHIIVSCKSQILYVGFCVGDC